MTNYRNKVYISEIQNIGIGRHRIHICPTLPRNTRYIDNEVPIKMDNADTLATLDTGRI